MAKGNAAAVWALNYHLLGQVLAETASDIEELGIEPKAFFVLAEIDQFPYPADLALRLSMPKPTITVYLKTLEADGFVKREIDAKDLRRHRLMVTASGRKIMTAASNLLSASFANRMARLSASEREAFQKTLEKLTAPEET